MEYFENSMKFWRYASRMSHQTLKRTWTVTVSIFHYFLAASTERILPVNFPNKKMRSARKRHYFQRNNKALYKHKYIHFYDSTSICSKQSILKKGLVPYNILILSSELWHNSDTSSIALSPWNFNINRKAWKKRHAYRFRVRKIRWA